MRKGMLAMTAVMCCLLLCSCARLPTIPSSETVSATGATTAPLPSVTVTVEGGSAEVGDTVILPVTVSADARLVDADVLLQYDPAVVEPVLQYDAATDSERYAEIGSFDGSIRSEKLRDGTLYVMLASAEDGSDQKSTLFYVAFRLLSAEADGSLITPEIPSCHLRVRNVDRDAVAAGALTLKPGSIVLKQPTTTETGTTAAE